MQKNIGVWWGCFMAAVYAGVGIFVLILDIATLNLKREYQTLTGIILILYGVYRAARVWRKAGDNAK